ncbi:MAG: hypothetical protein KJ709_06715 [Nanoarchaeota archaeon]|nr:hypothetical protein [Nanoarchaeota archaeon]
MYQTEYILSSSGRRLPYIEKGGLKIIARPLGVDPPDEVERNAGGGHVNSQLAEVIVTDDGLRLGHPEIGEANEDGCIEITMSLRPAGLPGYNISFPTRLGFGKCIEGLMPVLYDDVLAYLSVDDMDEDDTHLLFMYSAPYKEDYRGSLDPGIAKGPALACQMYKGNNGFSERKKQLAYQKLARSLRLSDLVTNTTFLEFVERSPSIIFNTEFDADAWKKEPGKFPFFWYETGYHYEDGSALERAFFVNASHYDQAMFDVLAKASAFPLGREEFLWLESLFKNHPAE